MMHNPVYGESKWESRFRLRSKLLAALALAALPGQSLQLTGRNRDSVTITNYIK